MATSAGVTVTGITNASGIVTVATSAAHGLAVNQGFSLTAVTPTTLNQNGTVKTVPTSTTFTFAMVSPPAYTSGGNVKPAKQVVVLNINANQPGDIQVQYVKWLTTLFPVAKVNAVSVWSGASTQENAAIAAGTTLEQIVSVNFPSSYPEASIESFMAADYLSEQVALAASTQPGQFYGVFYDGTGWSG